MFMPYDNYFDNILMKMSNLGPGIVGIIHVHGNGFYCPDNVSAFQFVLDANCAVDAQKAIYPLSKI